MYVIYMKHGDIFRKGNASPWTLDAFAQVVLMLTSEGCHVSQQLSVRFVKAGSMVGTSHQA